MLLLPLLALAAAWSHGQAQVLLKQTDISVTRGQTKTAWIDCVGEGISDFKTAYIHWYRQIPPKAPERVLYIGSGLALYDDDSYRNKYTSSKKGTNVCTFSVEDINSNDEGGDTQAAPSQTPALRRQVEGSSASMVCRMSSQAIVHWYKHLPGEPPRRILYMSGQSPVFDNSGDERRFQVRKHPTELRYDLTIDYLTPRDSGIYYYGFAQEIPVQSPISITKFQKSARMTCEIQISAASFDGTVIHWYQQKEGKAPERLLYYSGGKASVESGFQADRYMVEKVPRQKMCILTINDVIPDDSATYYCAYWDSHCGRNSTLFTVIGYYKVFGSGTKLIVSDKIISSPASSEILQKRHENQIMYVCLIEKFYPEVIRVTWTDGADKEVTDNIVKGDVWKPTNGDKYSIGSWLTVPVENKDKNYYCKYEHENQQRSLSTQDSRKTATQQKDCSPGNSTVNFNRDHLMHRTAYLVYIVLLLKSSMYYLIVLFLIYRMWAPTKHQGKKT
ncbi:unnamed protein product [Bubo scandiacus]